MKSRYLRLVVATSVLIATIGLFMRYFITHPSVRLQLAHTSGQTLLGLLLLYLAMLGSLVLVTTFTLHICRTPIPSRESIILTAYSGLVNFLGPLQSGPAFRAVYLKKKHGLLLKDYTAVTFIYYFFYAIFSVACLLFGWLHWWLIPSGTVLCATVWLLSRQYHHLARFKRLDLSSCYLLALATFLQVFVFTLIYYVELRSVSPGVHFTQAIVYTGAANLALFVSITPGAIGFRESFLVFSQHLHRIPDATIVAANILDRASYIFILLLVAIVLFGSHLRRELDTPDAQ